MDPSLVQGTNKPCCPPKIPYPSGEHRPEYHPNYNPLQFPPHNTPQRQVRYKYPV